MSFEQRIIELNIKLPEKVVAGAKYTPVKKTGKWLFVSGQIPMVETTPQFTGKVGNERDIKYAQKAAELCILNLLGTVRNFLGSLDEIEQFVKLQVFVNSETGFQDQHLIADTASDMLTTIFGDKGTHARTTIGTNQLPMDVTVEIEAIIEVI